MRTGLWDRQGANIEVATKECMAWSCFSVKTQLIEWNGYETHQTPLLYVFVDLKVHNVQKNSYHFDCIDQ